MKRFYQKALEKEVFSLLSEVASSTETPAYVVGGYVRDYLLDIDNDDIDIVVEGSGIEFARVFANKVNGKFSYYENYGTAMVKFNDQEIEFVGARKEMYERGSRKPIVEEGTLYDDISRRDFTINAMALSLNQDNYGELIDYFNGYSDLQNKLIRTPLEPSITFSDDPLRMFRAVRFMSKLAGFEIDEKTKEAIKENVFRTEILTRERITGELEKMLSYYKPLIGLQTLKELGLWEVAFVGCPYDELHVQCANMVGKVSLRWFFIAMTRYNNSVTDNFKVFTNAMRLPNDLASYMGRVYDTFYEFVYMSKPEITVSEIRHVLYKSGKEASDGIMSLWVYLRLVGCYDESDVFDWYTYMASLFSENERFIDFKLPCSGREIGEWAGLPEGVELGRLISEIKEEILSGRISESRQSIYAFVRYKQFKKKYFKNGEF